MVTDTASGPVSVLITGHFLFSHIYIVVNFRQFIEEWDEEDFKRRYRFGELKLNLSNLPPNVLVNPDTHPSKMPSFSVMIDFYRQKSPMPERVRLQIPFGKGQAVDFNGAIALAKKIVADNKDRYTKVDVLRYTKHIGRGIFGDESDREYF